MCNSFVSCNNQAIEIEGVAVALQVEEHAHGMCQHLPNEPLLIVPQIMNPNPGDKMRRRKGHFDSIIRKLEIISALRPKNLTIKINTVVSAVNKDYVSGIIDIVGKYKIDRWSIYQYWPLINNPKTEDKFRITENEFLHIIQSIPEKVGCCIVEKNTYKERVYTYFFVSHSGTVYTHDPDDPNNYVNLGSIFEDETIERWKFFRITSLREKTRLRYITTS